MERMKEELEAKYNKDVTEKDKQNKIFASMQEKMRKDLEAKL